jgi:hypothetical protein
VHHGREQELGEARAERDHGAAEQEEVVVAFEAGATDRALRPSVNGQNRGDPTIRCDPKKENQKEGCLFYFISWLEA